MIFSSADVCNFYSNQNDDEMEVQRLFTYFATARHLLTNQENVKNSISDKKEQPVCVCLHRKIYIPRKHVEAYKDLLSRSPSFISPTSATETDEFKKLQALHQQIQLAQLEASSDLAVCLPCGHRVLPISIEDAFLNFQYRWQISQLPDPPYEFYRCENIRIENLITKRVASIAHIRSFGDQVDQLKLNTLSVPHEFSPAKITQRLEEETGAMELAKLCEAHVISSVSVLIKLVLYLCKGCSSYFPITVSQSNHDAEKVLVTIGEPILSSPLTDSRLRTEECYRQLCKEAFIEQKLVEHPKNISHFRSPSKAISPRRSPRIANPSSTVNYDPIEALICSEPPASAASAMEDSDDELVIDFPPSEEDQLSPRLNLPPPDLKAIAEQCVVVETFSRRQIAEKIKKPLSAEPGQESSPSSPVPSPPDKSDHSAVLSGSGPIWRLFSLSGIALLLKASPVQMSPSSCCACVDPGQSCCPFWPNCSEIWHSDEISKQVHLSVKPEYLLPWGCEQLSEDELFATWLGASLDCPDKREILRLRIDASTGNVIFAEHQSLEQMTLAYPNFRPAEKLSLLVSIVSDLLRLQIGKYLLTSRQIQGKTHFDVYQSAADSQGVKQQNIVDLSVVAKQTFKESGTAIITPPISSSVELHLGAPWRIVRRLPIDLDLPSGRHAASGGLMIPGIDAVSEEECDAVFPASKNASLSNPKTRTRVRRRKK